MNSCMTLLVALGCLMVACLSLDPRFAGSKPVRCRWILMAIKIRSTTSFRGEVKPSVPYKKKYTIAILRAENRGSMFSETLVLNNEPTRSYSPEQHRNSHYCENLSVTTWTHTHIRDSSKIRTRDLSVTVSNTARPLCPAFSTRIFVERVAF
jgi:hypothetical protein